MQWPRSRQHTVKPDGGCLHGRPNFTGRRTTGEEPWKGKDPSRPSTCQRCKQEERKEDSLQVSGIPPGPGTIHRPLPEESDTIPKCGQKEASTVPSPYPQEGRWERSITERGLLTQVMGTGTRGKKRGTLGKDRMVPARSYGPT